MPTFTDDQQCQKLGALAKSPGPTKAESFEECCGNHGTDGEALYPNRDDLLRNYPELEPEDIEQAPVFAAANFEDSAAETDAA